MKIRNGLVSNSSASSFICIIRKEAFERELIKADSITQNIIGQLAEEEVVFGIPCMAIREFSGRGGESTWDFVEVPESEDEEDDEDGYSSVYEHVTNFLSNFEDSEHSCFSVDDGG